MGKGILCRVGFFSHCGDKILGGSDLVKAGLVLAYILRVQSITVRKVRQRLWLADGAAGAGG